MPEEYKLLKTQKNEVFKILREAGLEPANFSWAEYEKTVYLTGSRSKKTVPRLNYLDGDYYFQFEMFDDKYHCEFSPSHEQKVQYGTLLSWATQKVIVETWAEFLKKEIEAPDLWQEIEKYRAALPLVADEQLVNEPIPAYEVEEIAEKMQLLADKIEEQFELDEEQNQFVRTKLNYLTDAAKRQPRRDWENILISVFIGIAFQLALDPTKAQQFWQLVKGIIGPFIHLIGS